MLHKIFYTNVNVFMIKVYLIKEIAYFICSKDWGKKFQHLSFYIKYFLTTLINTSFLIKI